MADEPKKESDETRKAARPSEAKPNIHEKAAKPKQVPPRPGAKAAAVQAPKRIASEKATAKATPTLEERYSTYIEHIAKLQEAAAIEYQNVVGRLMLDLANLRNDMVASDPTKAFLQDLVSAYEKSDASAVSAVYTSLAKHMVKRQITIEKRYRDLLTASVTEVRDLSEKTRQQAIADAKDYYHDVTGAIGRVSVATLDPQSRNVLSHGILVGALLQGYERT